jgi:hypothetical protein
MALPLAIKGFMSCGGVQFLAKFVSWFLHECEHLGSAFVDARLRATFAMAHSLADRHLLSEIGQFRRYTDHGAKKPGGSQKLHRRCEADRSWVAARHRAALQHLQSDQIVSQQTTP